MLPNAMRRYLEQRYPGAFSKQAGAAYDAERDARRMLSMSDPEAQERVTIDATYEPVS